MIPSYDCNFVLLLTHLSFFGQLVDDLIEISFWIGSNIFSDEVPAFSAQSLVRAIWEWLCFKYEIL
jgi:hypothetical protein